MVYIENMCIIFFQYYINLFIQQIVSMFVKYAASALLDINYISTVIM